MLLIPWGGLRERHGWLGVVCQPHVLRCAFGLSE